MKNIIPWLKAHRWTAGIAAFLLLWAFVSFIITKTSLRSAVTRGSSVGSLSLVAPVAPFFDDAAGFEAAEESVAQKAIGRFPTAGETAAEVEQRIIKTGTMRVVVDKIASSVETLTDYAGSVGGFIESSSIVENRSGKRTGHVVLRVPVDRFEETIAKVRDIADLVREETTEGRDVTEQYTDLEAQLRNARAQEEAYLAILKRAFSVKDILSVQRELGTIRSQIERLEGRLKYLENRTAFSTLRVSLEEDIEVQIPTKKFKPVTAVKQATQALVAAFQGVVITLIWTVIVGLGLGLPSALVIWIVYSVVRRLISGRKR